MMNPKYWGKTAAGVLPLCMKTGRVMLALRSQEVMEPGTWGIFGGRVMDGSTRRDRLTGEPFVEHIETPEEGALREFREETFYSGSVELVPLLIFRDRLHGFAYHNFLGLVKREFPAARVECGWETDVARWMSLQEAAEIEPKHFGLRALLDDQESLDTIAGYAMVENAKRRQSQYDEGRIGKFAVMQGFTVWLFDGDYVRSVIGEAEFSLGGHHWRYPFIPWREIWVEDTGNPLDVYTIAMQNLIEAQAMRVDGLDYDTAHEIAASHEADIRQSILEILEKR